MSRTLVVGLHSTLPRRTPSRHLIAVVFFSLIICVKLKLRVFVNCRMDHVGFLLSVLQTVLKHFLGSLRRRRNMTVGNNRL